MRMPMNLEVVKDYYGRVLKTSKDLKTSACCEGGSMPAHLESLARECARGGAGQILWLWSRGACSTSGLPSP